MRTLNESQKPVWLPWYTKGRCFAESFFLLMYMSIAQGCQTPNRTNIAEFVINYIIR